MNIQRIASLVEEHIEKGIVALAALFLVVMVWMCLIRTPNRVEFAGRTLGPRELAEAVYEEAKTLESRLRTARGSEPQVERFADRLREVHRGGIFASAEPQAPPLPQELPPSAPLGRPVTIPGLEALAGQRGTVALITPQAPVSPVVENGRSQVIREPLDLDQLVKQAAGGGRGLTLTAVRDESATKKVETSWVTVAAYYDPDADAERMKKAGYASYRTRVYLVGTEVQRQELQPGGMWSDWATVSVSEAMPKLKLPKPEFDPRTGKLLNRAEMAQVLQVVQQQQTVLMEPPFYVVEAGDEWQVPELPNLEEPEMARAGGMSGTTYNPYGPYGPYGGSTAGRTPGAASPGQEKKGGEKKGGKGGKKAPKPPRPAPPVGTGRGRTGGGAVGPGGVYNPYGPGGYPGVGTKQRSEADIRREQIKEFRTLLSDARDAAGNKDWATVRQLAGRMLQLDKLPSKYKRQAERVLSKAEKELGAARGTPLAGGPAGFGKAGSRVELILPRPLKNRDTGEVAVWFHDDTVQPGRVYRYRMRVLMWNRYLGVPQPLKNPQDARKIVLAGEWSSPTEPVEVRAQSYFFVQGRKVGEPVARVEVWRFHEGRWLKEVFDVTVGDVIGGIKVVETDDLDDELKPKREKIDFSTGAVVLDIRFNEPATVRQARRDGSFSYSARPSVTIVYLDPSDGNIKQRTQALDRNDPVRDWLERQVSESG